MRALTLVLAGAVALLASACIPSRGPTATLNEPAAPQGTTVTVPTKLTSSRPEPASNLILGVQ